MLEVRVTQTGYAGAPGVTAHYFVGSGQADATAAGTLVKNTYQNGFAGLFPTAWHWQLEPEVRELDAATGALVGVFAVAGFGGGGGAGAAGFGPLPCGLSISWQTAAVVRGHRVRGRTFMVPIASSYYESDGSLTAACIAAANTAATALRAGPPPLAIWTRPVNGAGGNAAPVTGHNVRDVAAVLRSRRD